jgi:alpha-tubulin suppressor-like RCC1 family protein
MKVVERKSELFALVLCGLWLSLTVRVAPAPPVMTVTPANPTINVGQAQQFTASGANTPTVVSAGGEYTCVRLPDGTVQCAGRNQFGQLANGTLNNSSVLGAVTGLTTATRVIAGDEFACALLADATARCWGLGEKGQRGDGTLTQMSTVPVSVSGLAGAAAVTAGYNHACALLTDGTMRCWGANDYGQLGNPFTPPPGSSVPVAVSGITGATAITAGAFHTCAVLRDSTLRCWGQNDLGQLGNGTFTSSSTPVTVRGTTGATGIAGGGAHTCALLVDGTVQCWGNNYQGQLGDGTSIPSSTPVRVVGITGASAVAAGWQHTCAPLRDGTVQCWGENAFGQLGDGTMRNSSTPVPVVGIAGAVGVTSGWWHHSCALLATGMVRCWGVNEWGQFGNGTTTSSSTPVTMSGTGVTWTSSNTSVATVNATGLATAVGRGPTTITATDPFGNSGSTTLTVTQQLTLAVIKQGDGLGTVTSNPAGITCGSTCSASFTSDTPVTLTATPGPDSIFTGWTGCDSVSGATCTVTTSATRTVTAIFMLQRFTLTVSKTGIGRGTVTSSPAGINCGTACSSDYVINTTVTLTATPEMTSIFNGWTGCDSVSAATCTVTMRSATSVTANFVGVPF